MLKGIKMQILLTQEEYDTLLEQKQVRDVVLTDQLQEICTLAAKHIPVERWWCEGEPSSPWGCILDKSSNHSYCDECPVAKICPHEFKQWSK